MGINTSNFSFQGVGIADILNVHGCTDDTACNYNALATIDDGSCLITLGCTEPLASNFDPLAQCDDGSCNCVGILGCTEPTACNYDALAICNDGSCIMPDGCTDPTAINYDANAVCDDMSCIGTVYGCMDVNACNYNSSANVDDGSCGQAGCMDPMYMEYDASYVCSDASACIILIVYGCTDPTQFGYNPSATIDDGSCTPIVTGCTDPNASSGYDPLANTNDGSCIYLGCTDSDASNYDNAANQDDGSCAYATCDTCGNCIGDTNYGGVIFWLDGNCGGLVASPTELHEYTAAGGSGWMPFDHYNHCSTSYTGNAGASGTAIGTGASNHAALMAFQAANNCNGNPNLFVVGQVVLGATQLCEDYSAGGYTDWFLPSIGELQEMINTVGNGQTDPIATNSAGESLINIAQLGLLPSGAFYSRDYWSSTEYPNYPGGVDPPGCVVTTATGTWPNYVYIHNPTFYLYAPEYYAYAHYDGLDGVGQNEYGTATGTHGPCRGWSSDGWGSNQQNHKNIRAVRAF